MSTNKSIAKFACVIGIATLCSRILGFIRDIVIARMFGVYVYAQAFVVAFRIPNLFRDFVGEGAANAAFVPVFTDHHVKHTKEEFWHLANVVLNLLLLVLMAVTLLGILFSPVIVRLIAPGFISDPYKLETTINLNRIIFPYILLIGLAAYTTAMLNSLKHFSIPAFAPCLLNISIIACALLWGEGTKGLALGILVGGALQLAVQIPVLHKMGFRFRFTRDFKHPGAKLIGKLMLPRIFSSSIYQLNNFVDSIFGSLSTIVGEGGVAVLYYSYRLILFPLGIFSNALSQVILPTFSTQVAESDHDKLKHTLVFGLRATFFIMLPASAAFMALGRPIVNTLFQGGKFDAYSAEVTNQALFFYSIGLFAYGANRIVQSCFFALKDTVTPAKVSLVSLIMNTIFCAIFMFPLKIAGLALATSISGIVSFLILFYILKKRIGDFSIKYIWVSFLRCTAASVIMAIVCYFIGTRSVFISGSTMQKAINLIIAIAVGMGTYFLFCFIFRVQEARELLQWVIKRKKSV